MSLRKHRDKATGRKIKHRRMPSPDEQKLGTRVHEEENNHEVDALQCATCGEWFNSDDLENGVCFLCVEEDSMSESEDI